MADVLGLILFAVFIVVIISLAAGVTWVVVRASPKKKPAAPAAPNS
jgi:hypothetical protein